MNGGNNLIVSKAAEIITKGGVIAYPTSSIWGLGCSVTQDDALIKLCNIKQRATSKGLIIIAGAWEQLAGYFPQLSAEQIEMISTPTAHPCTWLVEDASNKVSQLIKGEHGKGENAAGGNTKGDQTRDKPTETGNAVGENVKVVRSKVAIRIDQHLFVKQLCALLGEPITSTSANPAGKEPAQNAAEVRDYFTDSVDYIVEGDWGASNSTSSAGNITGRASDIRDLASGAYIRR